MKNLKIYCVTNKVINFVDNTNYNIGWVGEEKAPKNYISCNSKDNIFFKEKYYSELTFQYWYWKNMIDLKEDNWIGFCQKRRFWINKNSINNEIEKNSFSNHVLQSVPDEWEGFDSVICKPIHINKVKKMKMIKRGFKSIIKNPSIFFNEKKQSLTFHFDMHHGYGNLNKAINLLNKEDRNDFFDYCNKSISYNPHIMFIAKPNIVNAWFEALFPWLLRCEKEFGFKNLQGYDTQRLYAYLAERYLSFWFNKYTKTTHWPWKFFDTTKN
tara:strand:- start:714 stop:1520 length:807 start_codon:yes stop_codon:yes gene_type:complete